MKYGWVIYNKDFESDKKFREHVDWFVDTAQHFSVLLEAKSNTDILFTLSDSVELKQTLVKKPEFVLFFDKDVRLAQLLEAIGIKVFNNSKAIEICDDKTLTQIVLSKNGIKTPKTIICPKSFFGFKQENLLFLDEVCLHLSFPLILKESLGSFGNEVYFVHNKDELLNKVLELTNKSILFQEYIQESHGRDIRMYIVGGEFVGAVMRSNTKDFRANAANGGVMSTYIPTEQEIEIAKKACLSIGLDFAGVDILFAKEGPIICEVNSNAHMKNFYNTTGIDVVKKIFEHIAKNI